MTDIFISYAREDEVRISFLAKALEERGWSVFWDRKIPTGTTWRKHIGQALSDAGYVVVVWTTQSVKSNWVTEEAEEAKKSGKLIPILLDDVEPPLGFREIQCVDLIQWQPTSDFPDFDNFLQDIKDKLENVAPKTRENIALQENQSRPLPLIRPKKNFRSQIIIAILVVTVGIVGYLSYEKLNFSEITELPKNPFGVIDVPKPLGSDVLSFANSIQFTEPELDENAVQWTEVQQENGLTGIGGKWASRWRRSSQSWYNGTARVIQIGEWVFILYKDRYSYLITAKQSDTHTLIGRYHNLDILSDSTPWIGKIINERRIDGYWSHGRWDFRR